MKNVDIDAIIAKGIANCKGNLHCENATLKAGMHEALQLAREDVASYERKDKHLENTMEVLLIVLFIMSMAMAIKGLVSDSKLIIIAILIALLVLVGISLGNYIFILSALGVATIGFISALFWKGN